MYSFQLNITPSVQYQSVFAQSPLNQYSSTLPATCSESIIDKMYSFRNVGEMLIFFYNYLYPQFLKDMITSQNLLVREMSVFEMDVQPDAVVQLNTVSSNWRFHNEYLNEIIPIEKRTLLGEDILKRGMFFPFFGHDNLAGYGSHRLHSLQTLHKTSPFHKKFLHIQFPKDIPVRPALRFQDGDQLPDFGVIDRAIEVPLIDINTNKIFMLTTTSLSLIWCGFTYSSDIFGDNMYQIKDRISPHPIFNDYSLFQEFLQK